MLIAAFLAFVTIFGYIIGFAWLGDPTRALFGLALALVVGVVSGLVSYFAGDKMVLAASRARRSHTMMRQYSSTWSRRCP